MTDSLCSGKLVVIIPDICGHGPSVNTIISWVTAGYCVLTCNYKYFTII